MFQVSPQRLLQLGSKIHPPLPLSPRESQQLLNVLTTSFRKKLNEEHGDLDPSFINTKVTTKHPSKRTAYSSRPSAADHGTVTNRHLKSLFSNPLFNIYKDPKILPPKTGTVRDPMDLFDEACARGLMKIKFATSCLQAKKVEIAARPVSLTVGMKDARAGWKVLKWLSSAGLTKRSTLEEYPIFTSLLVEFLVVEGHEDLIWAWIQKLFEDELMGAEQKSATSFLHQTISEQLLRSLIGSLAGAADRIDAAIATLARAKTLLEKLNATPKVLRDKLRNSGKQLAYIATKPSESAFTPPSASSYELFLKTVPAFTGGAGAQLYLAHLHLHHPTKPDARPAINFLSSKIFYDSLQTLVGKSDPVDLGKLSYSRRLDRRSIVMALEAAKLLLEQGQLNDAKWVMEVIASKYPSLLDIGNFGSIVGPDGPQGEISKMDTQRYSLELLQGLDMA